MITRLRIHWTEAQERRVAAEVLPASSWGTRLELYNTGITGLDENEMKIVRLYIRMEVTVVTQAMTKRYDCGI